MTLTTRQRYGFHIDRAGAVYRLTRPARNGRPHLASAYLIGYVWREGDCWRNDQCCDRFSTRELAAKSLDRLVLRHELVADSQEAA